MTHNRIITGLAFAGLCDPSVALAATIEAFSPQGTIKDVRQVAARFSAPMVAFGDPRLPEPFEIDCATPGRGRWADTRNWVYDFGRDLPAGLLCQFTLRPGLQTLSGAAITGRRKFSFDTGGPSIRASLPADGDSWIDAGQVFVLALDAPASTASVTEHAYCAVENIAERIPVELLAGKARESVLAQRRRLGYRYTQLFSTDSAAVHDNAASANLSQLESRLTVLRCRRPLPPETKVSLVWGRGIATMSGRATRAGQTLSFRTRPDFTVRMECERVNPNAACLPMQPLRIVFSAPVPAAKALALTLTDKAGSRYAATEAAQPGSAAIESLSFPGPFPARGELTLSLPGNLTDDAGRKPQNAGRFPLRIAFDDYPPLVRFSGDFGILEAATGGVLPVTLRNVDPELAGRQISLAVSQGLPAQALRIDSDVEIARWLERVKTATARRGDWEPASEDDERRWREATGSESVFHQDDPTREFKLPVSEGGRSFEVVGIPLGEPGFHVVELASPRLGRALLGTDQPRYVATSALVTNMAVHFKWGRESSRVWVTALDSGKPVRGAQVRVSGYCHGRELWTGETDGDGIARIDTQLGAPHGDGSCDDWSQEPLMVSARSGKDLSFALSSWQQGISPGDFGTPVGWGGERDTYLAHTVFDRSLFRAGETVSMKHFFRQHDSSGLRIPPARLKESHRPARDLRPTELVLTHTGSNQRYTQPVRFDAAGIAESSWSIPQDARLGEYDVSLVRDEKDGSTTFSAGTLRVEQFRVPTMKAVVQPPSKPLVNPKDVTLDLFVEFLSGGGAARAPVQLRTLVEPRWVSFHDFADFTFAGADVEEGISDPNEGDDEAWWYATQPGHNRRGGESAPATEAQLQQLTLDDQGVARATVTLPAITGARSLVAELEYEDANGERLTTSARVALWPAGLSLGIRTDGWAASRDELRLQVVAVDPGGKPLANREITVDVFRRQTYSYRKRLIGGFYAYENKIEIKRLPVDCRGRTNRQGLLSCTLAPEASGEIVLRASARDAAGNAAVTSTTAWVAGRDDWWFAPGNADRMDLLPEEKEYQPGEKARFQVRMPFRSATALVTVEREGVLESYVTRLSGRSPVIEVPIDGRYAPNIYVSVLAVRGRVAGWRAWLADLARKLGLDWRLEGGAATAQVDLSKPAFKLGVAQLRVGWSAQRLDVTVTPSSTAYRVRDKAIVDVRVRRENGDRLPAGAEIALAAVDEGLLELRPNESWALLDAMMDERPIEVWTSTAQMQVVGKRHFGRKAVPTGGGGGRAGARELFDTLLLWRGRVKLDSAGRARIEVPLNDSLTSFRIVAVANAGDQYFGTGQASIQTTQDLMLHGGLPPLVREGDRYSAMFTVRNASQRTMTVRATAKISSEPISKRTNDVEPGSDGKNGSEPISRVAAQTVEIPPGGAHELVWPATVPMGPESVTWDVEVVEVDGKARDALRTTQQVVSALPVRIYQSTLTQLNGQFELVADRPSGAMPGRGGVSVALRPTLAGSLEGVREYMLRYPYSCLEQRLSKAVALRDAGRWNAEMARLPLHLDRDGLLRYFPTDTLAGSDTLTAYVLAIANEAGYAIPDDARARMIEALTAFVAGRVLRDSVWPAPDLSIRKLAAIEALSRYGAADASMLTSFEIEPTLWPTSAILDWTSLLTRVGQVPRQSQRRAEARQILRSRLHLQGTTMGFSSEHNDALWWLMVSGDVNSARAILTLLREPGWREDIPRMVRGVLERQQRGHWDTTTANAWGVLATESFSTVYESTPVTGRTVVGFGAAPREVAWPQAQGPVELVFPWPEGARPLSLAHNGTGRPWAVIQGRAALPLLDAVSSGYTIRRTVAPIEQRNKGAWTRGDVARITLTVEAQSDMGWVVVDDPIPAGSTILGGGLGRDSTLLTQGERSGGQVNLAFEERRFDGLRAYYSFVPKGTFTVEYTLRLNNPGTFQLPATRVEALYAPEMFGERPNAAIKVGIAP